MKKLRFGKGSVRRVPSFGMQMLHATQHNVAISPQHHSESGAGAGGGPGSGGGYVFDHQQQQQRPAAAAAGAAPPPPSVTSLRQRTHVEKEERSVMKRLSGCNVSDRERFSYNPLEKLYVPIARHHDGGAYSLDTSSFDASAYQLLCDGLLPPMIPIRGSGSKMPEQLLELRSQLEEEQRKALGKSNVVNVKKHLTENALVIGCDEAGRGPLAGPLAGAACARVLLTTPKPTAKKTATTNKGKKSKKPKGGGRVACSPSAGFIPRVAVNDSKTLTQAQVKDAAAMMLSTADFEGLFDSAVMRSSATMAPGGLQLQPFIKASSEQQQKEKHKLPSSAMGMEPLESSLVHLRLRHFTADPLSATDTPLALANNDNNNTAAGGEDVSSLYLRRFLLSEEPLLSTLSGVTVMREGNVVASDGTVWHHPAEAYVWSVALASHGYIDARNVQHASLEGMSKCSRSVWEMLADTDIGSHALASANVCNKDTHCTQRSTGAATDNEPPAASACSSSSSIGGIPAAVAAGAAAFPPNSSDTTPTAASSPSGGPSLAQMLQSRFLAATSSADGSANANEGVVLDSSDLMGDQCSRMAPLVLVDGSHISRSSVDYFSDIDVCGTAQSVCKGDTKSFAVATASILAKSTRDVTLSILDSVYPSYGFSSHLGYPTHEHFEALRANGVSPIHRKQCAPIRKMLLRQQQQMLKQPSKGDNHHGDAVSASAKHIPKKLSKMAGKKKRAPSSTAKKKKRKMPSAASVNKKKATKKATAAKKRKH